MKHAPALFFIIAPYILTPFTANAVNNKHGPDDNLIFFDDRKEFQKKYKKTSTIKEITAGNKKCHSNVYVYEDDTTGQSIIVKQSSEQNRFNKEVNFYEKTRRKYTTWPSYLPVYFGIIKNFEGKKRGDVVPDAIAIEFIKEPYKPLISTKENFDKLTRQSVNQNLCYRMLDATREVYDVMHVIMQDRRGRNILANLDSGEFKFVDFEHQYEITPDKNFSRVTDTDLQQLNNTAVTRIPPWIKEYPDSFSHRGDCRDYKSIFDTFSLFTEFLPPHWYGETKRRKTCAQ